ncbi:MAG: hypothetical protein V7636_745 [Actinomycetota bacterium]
MMLFIEMFTLNRAWNGLRDEELFWEPVPGSWSVRPVGECTTPDPFVVGEWAADMDSTLALSADGLTTFEPMTTIGWVLWHVGSMPGRTAELDFLGGSRTAESGWTSPYLALHPIFTTADEAVSTMRAGWRALDTALKSVTDEQLEAPKRFWGYGGPGPMATGSQILASTLNEISHHGTQIGVLRDLYNQRAS